MAEALSSRTTSENAEAYEAKNDDLVMRPCAVKNVKRIWTLVLGTKSIVNYCSFGTTSETTASFSFVKPECAEREKGDLVMRPCMKSLGPRGISRVEKRV